MLFIIFATAILSTALSQRCPEVWGSDSLHGNNTIPSVTRIVGASGKRRAPKYLVSFLESNDEEKPFCTGSLISANWVLTAASCGVTKRHAARIGGSVAKSGVLRSISNVITHEQFEMSRMPVSATLENDIAIVELIEPAPASAEFILLNPNASIPFDSTAARVTGYGVSGPGARDEGDVRSVDLPIISSRLCKESFISTLSKGVLANFKLNEDTQLCAGFTTRMYEDSELATCDACPGDIGGPLLGSESESKSVQIGITSFGVSCGTKKRPGVYTRVSAFLPWLREKEVNFSTSLPTSPDLYPIPISDPSRGFNDPICFPEDASVDLRDGSTRRMRELQIGDEVACGGGQFSSVFMFTHRVREGHFPFVRIHHSKDDTPITLSHSHYLFLNGVLDAAKNVKVGDIVELGHGDVARVVKVDITVQRGLYNPQTRCGTIVVDGVRASAYTTAVPPLLAHGLLRPLSAVYKAFRLDSTCGAFEQ